MNERVGACTNENSLADNALEVLASTRTLMPEQENYE